MNDGAIAEKLREHVKKTARSVGWVFNGHEISRACGCSYDDAIQALEVLVADGWLTKHYDLLPAEDEGDSAAWTSLSEVDVVEALVSNELYHPDSGALIPDWRSRVILTYCTTAEAPKWSPWRTESPRPDEMDDGTGGSVWRFRDSRTSELCVVFISASRRDAVLITPSCLVEHYSVACLPDGEWLPLKAPLN